MREKRIPCRIKLRLPQIAKGAFMGAGDKHSDFLCVLKGRILRHTSQKNLVISAYNFDFFARLASKSAPLTFIEISMIDSRLRQWLLSRICTVFPYPRGSPSSSAPDNGQKARYAAFILFMPLFYTSFRRLSIEKRRIFKMRPFDVKFLRSSRAFLGANLVGLRPHLTTTHSMPRIFAIFWMVSARWPTPRA